MAGPLCITYFIYLGCSLEAPHPRPGAQQWAKGEVAAPVPPLALLSSACAKPF